MWKFLKTVMFGGILGVVLGVIGFGVTTWQFWFACIAVNLAHSVFPSKRAA